MFLRIITTAVVVLHVIAAAGQTFTSNPNAEILDYATTNFPQTVTGLAQSTIDTTNFGVETVCIDLSHTWDSDLEIYLVAPDGSMALLVAGMGGDQDNFTNTCFNQDAADGIASQGAPFTGTFRPMGGLGLVNNGQNPNGTWTLRTVDTYGGDAGTVFSWSVTFGNNPASYFTITESALPIFIVNTDGQSIPDEPKIGGDLTVIWNSDGSRNFTNQTAVHYDGRLGIETRGASSGGMPKKSYSFELWDVNDNEIDEELCGFPAESDWVLSAQYTDKTLLRNMLSMHLIREMDWYAPRARPVELILDGEYKGVYILMDKVKRGPDRVDIAKLQPTEITGDDVTGGYILKLDKNSGSSTGGFESEYGPQPAGDPIVIDFEYPNAENIMPQQAEYIENYVNAFEDALAGPDFADPVNGYRKYADAASCVDALIISELSRSIDAYRKSFFLYKDKDSKNGKLVMAPIWDYDLTFGNVDFCDGNYTDGWQYNFNEVCGGDYWLNPFWWKRFTEDATFNREVRCRWKQLRQTSFSNESLDNWVDSMANVLNESQEWNYHVWQTMGQYVWPNAYVGPDYTSEIYYLKNWMHQRLAWLDDNFPGTDVGCQYAGVEEEDKGSLELYPNPFMQTTTISLMLYDAQTIHYVIHDASGRVVIEGDQKGQAGKNEILWATGDLKAGMYSVEVSFGTRVWRKRAVKVD